MSGVPAGSGRDANLAAQGRDDWMRRWAEGWLETLKDRPAERYYADLSLEAACDMIHELTEATDHRAKPSKGRAAYQRLSLCVEDYRRWRRWGQGRRLAFSNALVTWKVLA